jgi:two-component system LytT family response regulator
MESLPIRVIIADDDAVARERLQMALQVVLDLTVVAVAEDGAAAVRALRANTVDVAFLDVEMPFLTGFDVVAEIGVGNMPLVVFCSGYDKYAVRAFDAFALDFLLKPWETERLQATLGRIRTRIAEVRAQALAQVDPRLVALLGYVQQQRDNGPAATYPETVAVGVGTKYEMVRLADVLSVQADGDYVRLFLPDRSHTLQRTLSGLEEDILDPAKFARISRSAIIQIPSVTNVKLEDNGTARVTLRDGSHIACSRAYRSALEDRLHLLG